MTAVRKDTYQIIPIVDMLIYSVIASENGIYCDLPPRLPANSNIWPSGYLDILGIPLFRRTYANPYHLLSELSGLIALIPPFLVG